MFICCQFKKVLFYRVRHEVFFLWECFPCYTHTSYWDTSAFSIAVSTHYSVSAGVLITNSHTHAKLLTSVLGILFSFSICGSRPQKGTLPNPEKI